LFKQLSSTGGDRTKISLIGDYAMLDNLCTTRTQFSKWKCGKDLRVYKDSSWTMESTDQILPREGVDPRLSADSVV